MKIVTLTISVLIFAILASCSTKDASKPEFLEFRLRRTFAIKGGEIIVIRKVGNEWNAMLMGDEMRFSCQYQKEIQPKSEWVQVWDTLLANGLRNITNDVSTSFEDGDFFYGELTENGKFKRFTISNPEFSESESSKQLVNISNYLSKEFGATVFLLDKDKTNIGDYFITTCKDYRK